MAHPSNRVSLTPEIQKNIVHALTTGSYLETAAAFSGIDESTLFSWLRRGANEDAGPYYRFWRACKQAMAQADIRDLWVINTAARAGHWKASAWRLERKHPEQWGNRKIVHMGSMDELKSQEIDLSQFSDRELDVLETLLKKGKPREPADDKAPA